MIRLEDINGTEVKDEQQSKKCLWGKDTAAFRGSAFYLARLWLKANTLPLELDNALRNHLDFPGAIVERGIVEKVGEFGSRSDIILDADRYSAAVEGKADEGFGHTIAEKLKTARSARSHQRKQERLSIGDGYLEKISATT